MHPTRHDHNVQVVEVWYTWISDDLLSFWHVKSQWSLCLFQIYGNGQSWPVLVIYLHHGTLLQLQLLETGKLLCGYLNVALLIVIGCFWVFSRIFCWRGLIWLQVWRLGWKKMVVRCICHGHKYLLDFETLDKYTQRHKRAHTHILYFCFMCHVWLS